MAQQKIYKKKRDVCFSIAKKYDPKVNKLMVNAIIRAAENLDLVLMTRRERVDYLKRIEEFWGVTTSGPHTDRAPVSCGGPLLKIPHLEGAKSFLKTGTEPTK